MFPDNLSNSRLAVRQHREGRGQLARLKTIYDETTAATNALYFTGRQHAGDNLRDVLQHRLAELGRTIQMCDALSRNTPKLSDGAEIPLANCLAHGRRQSVEVAADFPQPCRHVLETLGEVYEYDAQARQGEFSPAERLAIHKQHSARAVLKTRNGKLALHISRSGGDSIESSERKMTG